MIGTDLVNPDFAELARAYGAHGERVERDRGCSRTRSRGRATAAGPALIELICDPDALTPTASLSETRERAQQAAVATG